MTGLCTSSVYSGQHIMHPHPSRHMKDLSIQSIKLSAGIWSRHLLIYSGNFDRTVEMEILPNCQCRDPALVIVEMGLWNEIDFHPLNLYKCSFYGYVKAKIFLKISWDNKLSCLQGSSMSLWSSCPVHSPNSSFCIWTIWGHFSLLKKRKCAVSPAGIVFRNSGNFPVIIVIWQIFQ